MQGMCSRDCLREIHQGSREKRKIINTKNNKSQNANDRTRALQEPESPGTTAVVLCLPFTD